MWIQGQACACLIFQGSEVSLQTLVFTQQSLDAGQVPAKVIRGHQLLLLLDPADGLIHIPVASTHTSLSRAHLKVQPAQAKQTVARTC